MTSNDVIVDYGAIGDDGGVQVGGRISAAMVCFVDRKLRRVLQKTLRDGPSVGNTFQDDFGRYREMVGPEPNVFRATYDILN